MHTVLPNFHIATGNEPSGRYSVYLYLYQNLTINSMSSSLHHLVPKLTGTNHSTWATQMEMVLIKDDLWQILCLERLLPERPAQEVRQWDSDARKATANTMLCLNEGVEQHLKGTQNPVDLWKKLLKLYEQKGYSSCFFIQKMFYELWLADYVKSAEENAMSLYVNAHRSLCQQLRSAGAIIDNDTEHQVLLFGLGDSYDSFLIATTQSFQQNDNDSHNYIDVESLIGQLLDEDQWRKGVKLGMERLEIGSSSTGLALYSNRKRQWSQRSQSDKPRPICNYCESEGHKQGNCWDHYVEKKLESRYTKPARPAEASIALESAGITPRERDLC